MSTRTVLLDTHALVWLYGAPQRIPAATREMLGDSDTVILVSAASAFELANKYRLGKMPEAEAIIVNWRMALEKIWAQEIGVQPGHALSAGALEWHHRDPFDRILAVQAKDQFIPLVSADPVMRTLPGLEVLW